MDVEGDFFLMCWREILLSSELYGETYIEERNIVLEPTVIYSVIIIIRIVRPQYPLLKRNPFLVFLWYVRSS